MARLYVSYSSRDRNLAQQLAAQLRSCGHQIAIDVDSLVPGIEWRRELMDKLLLCDGVVVLLTANAAGSPFVFSEIGSARASSSRFLIPVIVGDLPIHPLVQDIYAIRIPSGSTREIRKPVKKIDEAVKAHLRRSAARSSETSRPAELPRSAVGEHLRVHHRLQVWDRRPRGRGCQRIESQRGAGVRVQ